MRFTLPILLLAPMLLADQAADDYRRMIEQQKKHQEQFINRLELLPGGKRRLDQIVGLAVQDGTLTVKSSLLQGNDQRLRSRQYRAEVEGFDTPCMVMAHFPNKDSWYFTFSNTSYPGLEGIASLSINAQPSFLQISRNVNSRTRNYNITFSQSHGRTQFGQPDGVQFSVFSSDNNGRMNSNFNLSAPDFLTLRRKHSAAVREHLRPLLRDLHLDNLFAVEAIAAWQVFSDLWPGDTGLAEVIRPIIPRLDDDDYARREDATVALRKLGQYGALVIYLMPREGLSSEQAGRLDSIVASYNFFSQAEARRLRTDTDFLLDALYCEDPQIRRIAHRQLVQATGRDLPFNCDAPVEQREQRIEEIRRLLAPSTRPATQKSPAAPSQP